MGRRKRTDEERKQRRLQRREQLEGIARDVCRFVERLLLGSGRGDEKRALAVQLINAYVDLPFIGENAEAKVIGMAVDAAVEALNRDGGRGWDD